LFTFFKVFPQASFTLVPQITFYEDSTNINQDSLNPQEIEDHGTYLIMKSTKIEALQLIANMKLNAKKAPKASAEL